MGQSEVLVIDDDADLAESLVMALGRFDIAARSASDAQTAEFLLRNRAGDCIVCDYRLGGMSGIDLLPRLRAIAPRTPVIMITGHGDVATAVKALRAGAVDFLEKPVVPEVLARSIATAIAGSGESHRLRSSAEEARTLLQQLSPREREIASALASGLTSRQIAEKLGTSPRTIETHRGNILLKLQAKNTSALVRMVVLAEISTIN